MTVGAPFAVLGTYRSSSLVVEAKGELDMAVVDEFKAAFNGLDPSPEEVVVDLTGLTFMDSTGISGLLWAKEELLAEGVNWKLLISRGAVQRVLEVAGVLERLEARIVD